MKKNLKALLLIAVVAAAVFASTAGPNGGSTFGTIGAGSNWATQSNLAAEDAAVTTCTPASDTPCRLLCAKNLGFSIPAGATINGLTAEIKRSRTDGGGDARDSVVKLTKSGSAVTGGDKADVVTAWPTSLTYKTYGGVADLWSTTLSVAEVNAATFGVCVSVTDSVDGDTVNVDFTRVTITYTPASGPTNAQRSSGFFMPGS